MKPGARVVGDFGFDPNFDYVVCANDVVNPKPHAEPVLKALEYFAIQPEAALMVGDSGSDIQSGKNAGVKTVGITHGKQDHPVKDHQPDHVIDSLLQLLDLL